MSEIVKLHFFKHGGEEFFRLMKEENIPIQLKRHDPGTIVASGEIIEIVKVVGGLSIAPSLAAVIVQWLKNKASRKITVQTKDNVIVNIEGQDIEKEKLQELLDVAYSVSVIQTEPDKDDEG